MTERKISAESSIAPKKLPERVKSKLQKEQTLMPLVSQGVRRSPMKPSSKNRPA